MATSPVVNQGKTAFVECPFTVVVRPLQGMYNRAS
jgi:hypothetical protein